MQFDKEKFKALVHYIIWKAGASPGFGSTKLNKVLWFSDAKLFALTGKPITGAKYIREKYGPVPALALPMQAELEAEGLIKVSKEKYFSKSITHFRALHAPRSNVFSEKELQTINYWIDHISNEHTATSISDESHDYAWEIAKEGEELPLYAFWANRTHPSDGKDLEWAKSEAKRLGLS